MKESQSALPQAQRKVIDETLKDFAQMGNIQSCFGSVEAFIADKNLAEQSEAEGNVAGAGKLIKR